MVFPLSVGYERLFVRTVQLVDTQGRSNWPGIAGFFYSLTNCHKLPLHIEQQEYQELLQRVLSHIRLNDRIAESTLPKGSCQGESHELHRRLDFH